jgi:hypothetical protein
MRGSDLDWKRLRVAGRDACVVAIEVGRLYEVVGLPICSAYMRGSHV